MIRRFFAALFVSLLVTTSALAQLPTGWRAHDMNRPLPPVVTPGEPAVSVAAPSDAIVLFDGKDLSQWRDSEGNDAKWVVRDGVMESVPGSGYVFTRKAFGDVQLHVEWASPEKVQGKGQGRGNSGVFLMGKFEVQVLDSFDNRTYADGQAASLYGQYPPLVNASRKPGEWQSYDVIFHRPRFSADGELQSPARMTLLHNGVLVQDNVTALGPTSWLQHWPYDAIPDRLPLSLQDHGNPVRYRNIWIRPLDERAPAPPAEPYELVAEQLSGKELDAIVGKYGEDQSLRIHRKDRSLELQIGARKFEMIALSKSEFSVRHTASHLQFEFDENGKPTTLTYEMGGDKQILKRVDE